MDQVAFKVRPTEIRDRDWILDMVGQWGGTDYIVSRGRVVRPAELPGFCAVDPGNERLGLATYEVTGSDCQLVTLHALRRLEGIGTALFQTVRQAAEAHGCKRLWVITTNDNLHALRFYQRRGMRLVAVHTDLREVARRLKPSIPLVGEFGIPLRDELELETMLD